MIDLVVPFLLLAVLGGVAVLAVTDLLRAKKKLTSRAVPLLLYVLVLVLAFKELS